MELMIRTRTPVWTGGVDPGRVDRIRETGILGSLRWWYEVLVRGLGGMACDPSEGTCRFDSKKYEGSSAKDKRQRLRDADLCDVCQVFGATGWRRRFRLTIWDNTKPDSSVESKTQADRSYTDNNRSYADNKGKPHKPTWYFPDKPRSGSLSIRIQSLASDFPPEVIAGLIQFLADWGAIGARAQMGFGVIEIENGQIDTRPLYDWLAPIAGNQAYTRLPSLQNIFLARISPKDNRPFSETDTFNLKYDLRRLFADNEHVRHFIMGTVSRQRIAAKVKRIAAKVKMSRPYDGHREMRVWGWIPEKAEVYSDPWNRDRVVDKIYSHLDKEYNLYLWREMNSNRDKLTHGIDDPRMFLQSLLGLKERNDAT